jgi:protein-S-isoprenylcysteine O-methyltransferase Ste14
VPWRFFGLSEIRLNPGNPLQLLGLVAIAAGAILLLTCIFEFARSGKGTLSPVDAPRELVVRGLYRYVRNPMYLSVGTILLGELLLVRSRALFIYWIIWLVAVNLFVMLYEEPTLRRRFGQSYQRYMQQVGRWLPRLPRA